VKGKFDWGVMGCCNGNVNVDVIGSLRVETEEWRRGCMGVTCVIVCEDWVLN
jgi:hypothetical protein